MNLKLLKYCTISIGFILFIISCDPSTIYTFKVNNRTSKKITVELTSYAYNSQILFDTLIIIMPGEVETIFELFDIINDPKDEGEKFLENKIETLTIFSEGKRIRKDCMLRENWEYKAEKSQWIDIFGTPSNNYTLNLQETDL